MNIAVSTVDGKTICGHLGKCKTFIIYETEGAEIKAKRLTGVAGSCPSLGGGHEHEGHGHGGHNMSHFDGCHAVITQGMGQGMIDGLTAQGIQPVITDMSDPDLAVMKFLRGEMGGTAKSTCTCGGH